MNSNYENQKISGGHAIVEFLKVEKVSYVFGLIGSATMELFDALYDAKNIKFIDVRDERTGTHIADGYARASGKPGIIIAGQNGPGATNLVTGVAQAKAAFSPVISIAGAISTEHEGKDAFQEVDQQSLFEPITKKTFTVRETELIPETLKKAFSLALSPRCGPVHLNFPRNILANVFKFNKIQKHEKEILSSVDESDLINILEIMDKAKKPVIIAGGGVKNSLCHEAVLKISTYLNIPIVSSAGHGDAISSDEMLYAGQMGPRGNPVASKLVKDADVVLALGTRLGFNSTFYSYDNINSKAKIIQIDIDKKSLGRYFPISLGVCNDVKDLTEKLSIKIKEKSISPCFNTWVQDFLENKKNYLEKRELEADLSIIPIQPYGLFKILRETLPKNSAITLDAGTLCLQATDMLNFFSPKSFFTPLDFGLVGFSFACGLGVKLAKPDCPVISLMGDGGFGMTLSELSTAVTHKINTVTIVMNNKSWGAEKAYQRDFYNERYIGADINSPPFDKIAELYGAKGYHIEKLSDFKNALKDALNCNKPAVINVKVDPKALYSFRRDSFQHRQK
jgi:thiamine pyrophosphate-dependent acetolactate synthase large subunit-like protein